MFHYSMNLNCNSADVFADGRYKGTNEDSEAQRSSSTIWLARDSVSGILVALRVRAD